MVDSSGSDAGSGARPLEGRVAFVAGASRTIGKGAAVELAAAGAFVYAIGRTSSKGNGPGDGSLDDTLELIQSVGGRGAAVICDCSDPFAVRRAFERVDAEQGRLDVLVNSVFGSRAFGPSIGKRFWDTSLDLWHDVVDVSVKTAYITSWHAAPIMIRTAEEHARRPVIVNVSGRGAVRYRYNVVYGVGKAATERLTRDMALDLKDHDVAVVSIWPNGHPVDPAKPETPRYNGRAVVALATAPDLMHRSGRYYWSAEIGAEFGFTDEFGNVHEPGPLVDSYSLDS